MASGYGTKAPVSEGTSASQQSAKPPLFCSRNSWNRRVLELSVDPIGHQLRLPTDEQFTQIQTVFDAFKFSGQRPFLLLQRQNAIPLGLCRVQVD